MRSRTRRAIHNFNSTIHNFFRKTNNRSLAQRTLVEYTATYTDRGAENLSNNGCHACKRGELKVSEMVPLPLGPRLTLGDGSGDSCPVKPLRPGPLTRERGT